LSDETQSVGADALTRPPYDVSKLLFVGTVHLVSGLAAAAWVLGDLAVSWRTVAFAALWFAMGSTAITAGYHRLFAHPTYRASWPLKVFYLLAGASAFQGSALQWSAQHRDHHTFTDGARDPYNIRLGFWFAHIGWVVRRTIPDYSRVVDLQKDPLVRLQHRLFVPLALFFSFGLPYLLGGLWHEAGAALFIAGFVRLTIQWHMTFCVNSVAHRFGTQKYSSKHSATGSWWLAFLTWGEMDHNYHHTFPEDFRTGTRWWDFDPGKWWIGVCAVAGFASGLRRARTERVAVAAAARGGGKGSGG
jgi:stearoyl-CoA desaturase (delta-9 desaturase)